MVGIAVIFILATVVCLMISLKQGSAKTPEVQANPAPVEIKDEQDPERRTPQSKSKYFRIAGIGNYASFADIGPISGELRKEPENKYDKKAVMVLEANREKLLGYIAKNDQPAYIEISEGKDHRPFVGYIEQFSNSEGEIRLFGVIRTYSNEDEDEMMQDMQNDWDFLHAAFKIKSYERRLDILEQFKY